MEKFKTITAKEFDSIVPADDVCIAAGLVCKSQRRSLRHYSIDDGRELTVNIARNEWTVKDTAEIGTASTLANRLGLDEGDDFSNALQKVENLYSEREKIPYAFPFAHLSRPIWNFTETCHPKDVALGRMMTRLGLSMDIVRFYSIEGTMPKDGGKGTERVIAFRCGEDADNFMAFNGKSFRQIGDSGMTVFGTRRKDQVCMVYENPIDFLSIMESVERNGVYPLMTRRYHIVLNGKRGLGEACGCLRANPDFLEVRCFMPQTDTGYRLFASINDAVKGTAIDRSTLYSGYGSLLAKYAPKIPESYRKWKLEQIEMATRSKMKETTCVGQKEETPRQDMRLHLGGERKAVIDRREGGLRL